jgi:hypothetical protein
MSLTITIPGAVNVTTGAMAPAVLTIGAGVPGATGPAGPAGPGVPVGGTAGQYLQKIDGTNYNTDWVTLNLAAYAPLASPTFTGDPQAPTPATSDNDTSIATTAFVKAQGYLTSAPVTSVAGRTGAITLSNTDISGLGTMATASASNYSTTAVADTLYAPIAAGLPTGGTVGQVLTKNSGTNFDASFQTLIPGDRYLTSSTTSLTINNANKTLTVGTGLSYTPTQNITISYNAANHMHGEVLTYDSGTGVLTVDINNHTGSGTYASWVVNVGGVTPATSVAWGAITGTLGDQTDLATALNAKLDTSTAASTYAPIASPTFTGTVTIPAGASISGYLTSATAASTYAPLAGATFTGLVGTAASTTTTAGLNVPHGTAPTSPVNGDIWTTTSGVFARINAGTQQLMSLGNTQTVSGSITFSNASQTLGNSTATGTINVASGATISGSTKTVNIGTGGVAGSTTAINLGTTNGGAGSITLSNNTTINGTLNVIGPNLTLGSSTAVSTINLGSGATVSGSTKTVNIGTGGLASSTTTIIVGSTNGTTTTLQGTTNGVTAAADTNSVALATTAYVVGQAGSATPLVNGTAAVGTSLRYARADHVHPTDTTRLGDAPSDGSTYGRNNGAWVVAGGGGGGASTDYQAYTTPGTFTWTKPAGAKFVDLIMFGGGGGGGSGARFATSSGRSGGAGGGAAAYLVARFLASSLAATQSVTVGAGGTGGAAVTTDSTNGNTGGTGGNSVFFNLTCLGTTGGAGGNVAGGVTGGSGRTGYLFGNAVARSSGSGGTGSIGSGGATSNISTGDAYLTSPGGGGAGAAASSTTSAAGAGGAGKSAISATASGLTAAVLGGSGGTTAGVPAVAGISGVTMGGGGLGGGGGAYITGVVGMAGAAGGLHGGGGGGGAASDNGFASGAGGAGGGGAVYIITYC